MFVELVIVRHKKSGVSLSGYDAEAQFRCFSISINKGFADVSTSIVLKFSTFCSNFA